MGPFDVLSNNQFALLVNAVLHRIPIIIDGDRSCATGKTTLCEGIRALGADACEAWEIEEGKVQPNDDTDLNSVYVLVRLNKPLNR